MRMKSDVIICLESSSLRTSPVERASGVIIGVILIAELGSDHRDRLHVQIAILLYQWGAFTCLIASFMVSAWEEQKTNICCTPELTNVSRVQSSKGVLQRVKRV